MRDGRRERDLLDWVSDCTKTSKPRGACKKRTASPGGGVSAERDREMTGWLTDTTYTLGGERLAPLTYLFRVTACNLCIKVAVSASHPSMR